MPTRKPTWWAKEVLTLSYPLSIHRQNLRTATKVWRQSVSTVHKVHFMVLQTILRWIHTRVVLQLWLRLLAPNQYLRAIYPKSLQRIKFAANSPLTKAWAHLHILKLIEFPRRSKSSVLVSSYLFLFDSVCFHLNWLKLIANISLHSPQTPCISWYSPINPFRSSSGPIVTKDLCCQQHSLMV